MSHNRSLVLIHIIRDFCFSLCHLYFVLIEIYSIVFCGQHSCARVCVICVIPWTHVIRTVIMRFSIDRLLTFHMCFFLSNAIHLIKISIEYYFISFVPVHKNLMLLMLLFLFAYVVHCPCSITINAIVQCIYQTKIITKTKRNGTNKDTDENWSRERTQLSPKKNNKACAKCMVNNQPNKNK